MIYPDLNILKDRLAQPFCIPTDPAALEEALVSAQRCYELSKATEADCAEALVTVKGSEAEVWDIAYAHAVGSSQAAKKESAEKTQTWLAYEERKKKAESNKRLAERYHSIAYQRMETLRTAYARLPRLT